jgi:hypothetical protein
MLFNIINAYSICFIVDEQEEKFHLVRKLNKR